MSSPHNYVVDEMPYRFNKKIIDLPGLVNASLDIHQQQTKTNPDDARYARANITCLVVN